MPSNELPELTDAEIDELLEPGLQRKIVASFVLRNHVLVKQLAAAQATLAEVEAESERLQKLINNPHNEDWLEGVRIESAHQQERWGNEHGEGKEPQDWFWLIGYLAGKCLRSCIEGDTEKAKHHTISTAAVLLNWHRRISGQPGDMRPGILHPKA